MLGMRVNVVLLVAPFISSVSLQQFRGASHRFGYLRQVPAVTVSDDFQRHSKDVKKMFVAVSHGFAQNSPHAVAIRYTVTPAVACSVSTAFQR